MRTTRDLTTDQGTREELEDAPGTDAGMATAEYAMVLLAAAGFAGLLAALLASGEVRGLLLGIVRSALTLG